MAIQFPNFLAAQTAKPDYSGLADIVQNYYAGKDMPNDALIKKIQAEFARPTAEEGLKATQLKNAYQAILNQYAPESQKQSILTSRLSNQKSQMELDQQIELERQLRKALAGGGGGGGSDMNSMPAAAPMAQPGMQPSASPSVPSMPSPMQSPGMNYTPINPQLQQLLAGGNSMQTGAAAPNAQAAPSQSPIASNAPSTQPEPINEVVVAKGSPNLAGLDSMYDNNPLSRAFLEKKGYKKVQEVKFDNKTGKTTIITKYPSGKVTVQASSGAEPTAEGIPLTNKMISKHQNIISSVDVADPVLDQIINMNNGDYSRFSTTNRGAKYNGLVKQALDSVLGAFGMPLSDKGLDSVLAQLQIGHLESAGAYRKRIKELKADLQKRKMYSSEQVKKSNKISPVDTGASADTSNITESDPIWGGDNQ